MDIPPIQWQARHTVADTILHLNLIRSGYGMSLVLAYCDHVYPELTLMPETEIFMDRSIWILLHSDLRRTTRVLRFVGFVAAEL